jgi:hypothetical protein
MYDEIDPAESDLWITAIRSDPTGYSLPAYGPWTSVEQAAARFAAWYHDEINDAPSPALCRRCGRLIDPLDQDGRQVHIRCRFPIPEGLTPPPRWR